MSAIHIYSERKRFANNAQISTHTVFTFIGFIAQKHLLKCSELLKFKFYLLQMLRFNPIIYNVLYINNYCGLYLKVQFLQYIMVFFSKTLLLYTV